MFRKVSSRSCDQCPTIIESSDSSSWRWHFTKINKFLSFPICSDPMSRCMDDRLTPFYSRAFEFNAQITQPNSPSIPRRYFESTHQLLPYVGNGYFGIGAVRSTPFHVKYGRHLSQPVNFHPVVEFESADGYSSGSAAAQGNQAFVIDFLSGVVHKFQCFENEFTISSDFYGKNQSKCSLRWEYSR